MALPVDSTASTFRYTPDEDDIQVHNEGAIKIICKAFQSHEMGLPEWIKNSSDEYARCDASNEERIIVVLLNKGTSNRPSSISVLDFGGIDSNVIEQNFRHWADPQAATHRVQSSRIQGGHGNGGKCYMSMMFNKYSLLHTVKNNLGNRYGVEGNSVRFGYIPDRTSGRNFDVPDVQYELNKALRSVGYTLTSLPQSAINASELRQGFTLVTGYGPKGHRDGTARRLVQTLRDHPQMITSVNFCDIYIMNNGRTQENANPLALKPVDPDPYIKEKKYDIPLELVDPQTDETISTTNEGRTARGTLVLRTSDRNMRYSRKFRHMMTYRSTSGYIGYIPMTELDVQSPYINRIFGECELPSLEAAKLNTRDRLADSPLTRAVEGFIESKVTELAHIFEARERRSYNQREKNELSRLNEMLDKWKNQFLSEHLGLSSTSGKDPAPTPPPSPLPSGIPARIEVTLDHPCAGIGVTFRPLVKFYDKQERRIRPVSYQWISNDNNIAWVDPSLNVINTFAKGKTTLWAQTLDGALNSNPVTLRVLNIRKIDLQPSSITINSGGRHKIHAICTLSNGETVSDIALIWTEDNPVVAGVSAYGTVFGRSPGVTSITAGDDSCLADNNVQVIVTEGGGNKGNERGFSHPKILISSIDPDPETGEEVNLSYDDPPVWQRPEDVNRNIWWINSSAPLARMYLDRKKGYGYDSREWRIYHVERYIEIIALIKIISNPDLERIESGTWIIHWGEHVTEVQTAVTRSLGEFIHNGELLKDL